MRMSASQYRDLMKKSGPPSVGHAKPNRPTGSGPSVLEARFAQHLLALKLPVACTEYQFHPIRKWRFDFAWPEYRLAVEIEGGVLSRGRHVRPQGFTNDCEKYNQATQMGWRVLRFTSADIRSGAAIEMVQNILRQ